MGETLEVFPINYILKSKLKDGERGVHLKINRKDAKKDQAAVSLSYSLLTYLRLIAISVPIISLLIDILMNSTSTDAFTLILDTRNECAEVMRLLDDLHEVEAAAPEATHGEEYNVQKTVLLVLLYSGESSTASFLLTPNSS